VFKISAFGLELWKKKHLKRPHGALPPKFGNFYDVSMLPPALQRSAHYILICIGGVKSAASDKVLFGSTQSYMPTITSTDNKGRLELSRCASQFDYRLVNLFAASRYSMLSLVRPSLEADVSCGVELLFLPQQNNAVIRRHQRAWRVRGVGVMNLFISTHHTPRREGMPCPTCRGVPSDVDRRLMLVTSGQARQRAHHQLTTHALISDIKCRTT